jgi:hypothetical protein
MTAKSIKHKLQSAVADSAGAGVVKPSNWNDDHDFLLGVNAQTGTTYTFADADAWSLVTFSNASAVAVTLPQAGSSGGTVFKSGWMAFAKNRGAGLVTITPTTSTINSGATYTLAQNEEVVIISDGTNYLVLRCWALSQYANSFVRWDAAQALTDAQQAQARANVYAAPFDALAFNGMQINGAMEVSQERGSSSLTLTSGAGIYTIDQWQQQYQHGSAVVVAQQVAPPGSPAFGAAFQKCLQMKATTGGNFGSTASDIARIAYQPIEGYRFARAGFGNAAASPITVGFWVYATIAGTLAVWACNGAANRSYVTTVTVNNALTWEYKTVTIPGDTSGTWLTTNGTGLNIGVAGLCGSTFQTAAGAWGAGFFFCTSGTTNFFASNNNLVAVTGFINLPGSEAPSSARSPFIFRPFDEEIWIAKRYWEKSYDYADAPGAVTTVGSIHPLLTMSSATFTQWGTYVPYSREKRAAPSGLTGYSTGGAAGKIFSVSDGGDINANFLDGGTKGFSFYGTLGAASAAVQLKMHYVSDARM